MFGQKISDNTWKILWSDNWIVRIISGQSTKSSTFLLILALLITVSFLLLFVHIKHFLESCLRGPLYTNWRISCKIDLNLGHWIHFESNLNHLNSFDKRICNLQEWYVVYTPWMNHTIRKLSSSDSRECSRIYNKVYLISCQVRSKLCCQFIEIFKTAGYFPDRLFSFLGFSSYRKK